MFMFIFMFSMSVSSWSSSPSPPQPLRRHHHHHQHHHHHHHHHHHNHHHNYHHHNHHHNYHHHHYPENHVCYLILARLCWCWLSILSWGLLYCIMLVLINIIICCWSCDMKFYDDVDHFLLIIMSYLMPKIMSDTFIMLLDIFSS